MQSDRLFVASLSVVYQTDLYQTMVIQFVTFVICTDLKVHADDTTGVYLSTGW